MLFADHCQGDEQYLSILQSCDAVVLNMLTFPPDATAQQLMSEVKRLSDELEGKGNSSKGKGNRTCSIFFEESKSPSAKVALP